MALGDWLVGAIPPRDGDADGTRRWQWAVFVKLWLLIAFAFWALDMVPGFPGFARADDVRAVAEEVRQGRIGQLQSELFNLKVKACDEASPLALRQQFQEQLSKKQAEYFSLVGQAYTLPNCQELK